MDEKLPDWIPLPNGRVLLRDQYEAAAERMGLTVPELLAKAEHDCREQMKRIDRHVEELVKIERQRLKKR
jgi:hypothetical protein